MEIKKLEILVDLAQTLSYTETAKRLSTTQGNISKQIIALEKELETQLIIREYRRIRLTSDAQDILKDAQDIVRGRNHITTLLMDKKEGFTSTLTIHTIPTVSNYKAFKIIMAFRKKYPEIKLNLAEKEAKRIMYDLKDGQSDLIFMRKFVDDDRECETLLTEFDRFVVVVPVDHPLAKKDEVVLSDFKNERFLLLGHETNLVDPILKLVQDEDLDLQITYAGNRIDLVMNMVAANMGVSVITEKSILGEISSRIKILPLKKTIESSLCFARKIGSHSTASELFWRFVKNY